MKNSFSFFKKGWIALIAVLTTLFMVLTGSVFTFPAIAQDMRGVDTPPTTRPTTRPNFTPPTTLPFNPSITLPKPPEEFQGDIQYTAKESKSDFPKPLTAPKDAPNILLIMTDDVGFAASSPFGGPIATPTFEKLAKRGLRYNTFHTTALCSPTRAALITGRNHHAVHSGVIMEMGTGYPGYDTLMQKDTATIAETLKLNGYNTAWFGKNHNVPDWQSSQVGPFDLWPTGLGFEYFFGFLGGDTDQWHPAAFEGTKPVEKPRDQPDLHFDEWMADKAISYIEQQNALAPDKPFFVYYATGTAHAPHHAPKKWINKFKGQFDQGWDEVRKESLNRQKELGIVPANTQLTPKDRDIPDWDSLPPVRQKLYAHMMEVYAGALGHADEQIGRVIDAVEKTGELDNTLIIFIQGDNGASAEGTVQGTTNEVATAGNGVTEDLDYLISMSDKLGGPETYNHYPYGWAHAMDTPFQWTKQIASHFGGTRNGMVISWPAKIKEQDQGGIRQQFHHVIDVAPTILEATGIPEPTIVNGIEQVPIQGKSMFYSFANADAETHHPTQYFELVGNRAIYHKGWMASTTPERMPWNNAGFAPEPDKFKWELYHVAEDFSQYNDLAEENPQKLKELQDLWDEEARKYHVLPLDASYTERGDVSIRPSLTRGRSSFSYGPGMIRIPEGSAPDIKNKSYSITADVVIPKHCEASGVLATQGGNFGGWGLILQDGKPLFVHALSNQPKDKFEVRSDKRILPGPHTILFDFKYDGGGIGKGGLGTLFVDGNQVAQSHIARTVGVRFSLDETFDVGEDTGTAVISDYAEKMPFEFTGTLEKVTIDLPKEVPTTLPGEVPTTLPKI